MRFRIKNFQYFLLVIISISALGGAYSLAWAATETIEVSATVVSICGNETIEGSEECDGDSLGGTTCVSQGYTSGTLTCNVDCTFDTSDCAVSGGGAFRPLPKTKVIFKGMAYPNAEIIILKDGQFAIADTASSQANFKTELTDLTAGNYNFGFWGIDEQGRRSVTFNFNTTIVSNTITTINGILFPPTIELAETSLKRGEDLNVFGQTAPQGEVSIYIGPVEGVVKKTRADKKGNWSYSFNTNTLTKGSYTVRARAFSSNNLSSIYSQSLAFVIDEPIIEEVCPGANLNRDGRVDLVDFSILLYWWGKSHSCVDQNHDGIVDLVDFSILLYWWTG